MVIKLLFLVEKIGRYNKNGNGNVSWQQQQQTKKQTKKIDSSLDDDDNDERKLQEYGFCLFDDLVKFRFFLLKNFF